MQFLTLAQAEHQPYKKEYKYPTALSAAGFLLVAAASFVAALAAANVGTDGGLVGILLLGWVALWFAILALFLFKVLRDRLRPTNWLVRLQTNGILVKYRSYLNSGLPSEDPVAVFISFSEIEWVRENRMRRNIPGNTRSDDELRFETYAELKLRREADLNEVEAYLAAERRTQGPYLKRWYGGRSRGLSRHYPVHVASDGVSRIEWRVRPRLSSFLTEMKSFVAESPGLRSSVDYRDAEKLTPKQQEEILLELLATGNRIGALRAAKHLYGFDTTRAVQFLEELSPTGSKDSSSPSA